MANKAKTAATFRIVALLATVFLLVAAALVYLEKGGGAASAELAALSQSVPSLAQDALSGEPGAFDDLGTAVSKLAQLRRSAGGSIAGRSADWQTLVSRSSAILSAKDDVEAYYAALTVAAKRGDAIVQMSEGLIDASGSTAIMQQFQQRADRIRQNATGLTQTTDAGTATALADDVAYLRSVVGALAGEDSQLDVRALGASDAESILLPIQTDLTDLESQSATISTNVHKVVELDASLAELDASAANLGGAFVGSGSASLVPGFLKSQWIPIGLIGLAVLFVLVMLFLNSKSSSFERMAIEQADQNDRNQQAILRLLDEMGSLADGDLTVEATVTEDITGTIADSFNYAIEELRKLVATVNETSIMVDSAAKQTENTASHMAKAADNQAREINAATESVVSMAASIEEVSGNAERSSDVARHSVEVAHKGGEAVRRTIDGMNAIRETIQDTSKRIKRLGESSQEIGNIVELINDIAEQTNILALNASIQASMAGEAGRGFAVVADEVQRLAERSTNATKQIEVLVRTIQADTNEAVVSMERSTTDVVGGALLAENAGAALDEIEQVSNQIASLVQNISGSARQQASSAADVTRRTTRLREISEQTGKATTATAAAISKLSELASQLRKTVAGFTLPNKAMHASTLVATSANIPAEPPAGGQAKTG
jgi:twitching motility protein PilJ